MGRTYRKIDKREKPKKVKSEFSKKTFAKQKDYYFEGDDESYE